MKKKHITILGAGSFGCALALLLHRNQHHVTIQSRPSRSFTFLKKNRHSKRYLNDIRLPGRIHLTTQLDEALQQQTDLIILATPTGATRDMAHLIKEQLDQPIPLVSVAKGFDSQTYQRNSEVLKSVLGKKYPLLTLSGPTHAEEIAIKLPCSVTLACHRLKRAQEIGRFFHSKNFRVYFSNDVTGVEIGGAIKNTIALASGICDGLKLGDNTKAALITRGLVEIKRFGQHEGARLSTFDGLSGLGDLITTCFSPHGRNRMVGEYLGQGKKLKYILSKMKQVAEGVPTTYAVVKRAKQLGIEMPICQQVEAILKGRREPRKAVEALMSRQARQEF